MSNPDLRNIPLNSGYQNDLDLDVAIVGGGVSGLYSAYRLATSSSASETPLKVQVFEMSDRIAGRLESVTLPGMTITGELGGMRYLTSQQIVTSLIQDVFKLPYVAFQMGDPAYLLVYLRKQRLQANAWDVAQQQGQKLETHYYLNDDDVGFSADQLFNKVVYDVLTADPWFMEHYSAKVGYSEPYTYTFKLTSQDWDAIKPNLSYCFDGPYQNMKVNDLGFWNLIKDRISEEGYNFLAEAGGYYSNTINWNAAEAFPYMVGDFSDANVAYYTIDGGYDLIGYALAYYYLTFPDAMIWSENQLVTFAHAEGSNRRYQLTFKNRRSGQTWNVYADRIVLAMPRRSLELLDQDGFFFQNQQLQTNIESVIMEPSFKLLMGFEYPWWKDDFCATSGHSITDLPMRQCYYFGTDPNDSHSLFLSSYNDMRTVTFWKALDEHPVRFEPRSTQLVSAAQVAQSSAVVSNLASLVMVAEAMNQVRELHGPDMVIPAPYVALYKDWTDDPYGGGYHAWKAVYSVKDVMPFMRQPDAQEAIHICGEAYSDQQGWVEGAFCEAEKMLQEHFQLAWPEWLDRSYYLGW